MVTLIASHEVSDYEKWRVAFDDANNAEGVASVQAEGRVSIQLYRTPDSKRVVTVEKFDTLESAEKFRAFLENPEGQSVAESIGFIPPMIVWIVEEA